MKGLAMSFDEMRRAGVSARTDETLPPHSKRCPRCGEILFDDMDVCFGCLYDFTREPYHLPEGMIDDPAPHRDDGIGETCEAAIPDEPAPETATPQERFETEDLSGRKLLMVTPELAVGLSLPARGLTLGYASDNDIVLRTPGIAEYHLVLVPRADDVVAVGLVNDAFESQDVLIDRDCAFLHGGASLSLGKLTLGISRTANEAS